MKKIIFPIILITAFFSRINAQTTTLNPATTVTNSQLSVQSVIDNYIAALGGKAKLEAVKSTITENTMTVQDLEISMTTKKMGNKFISEQSVMDETVIQFFDGENGYIEQGGQRLDIPKDKIPELKKGKTIDALNFINENFTSINQVQLNGKNYNILNSDKGKFFFDATTGLLYKSETSDATATIKSYMIVEGVKFPELIEAEGGGQMVILKTTKVIINSGVTEADFKI